MYALEPFHLEVSQLRHVVETFPLLMQFCDHNLVLFKSCENYFHMVIFELRYPHNEIFQ